MREESCRAQGKSWPAAGAFAAIVETLMPAATCCPSCKGALFEIGRDESQRLDVVPAQYRVIVTRRPKLACRACHGVVLQHAAPERLIRGGLPTERLVAHVIDAKYHWHLPLYRQAQMLATHGIAIDRSTLAFWVGYAAQELKPLWATPARYSARVLEALCR
jgi:transposase